MVQNRNNRARASRAAHPPMCDGECGGLSTSHGGGQTATRSVDPGCYMFVSTRMNHASNHEWTSLSDMAWVQFGYGWVRFQCFDGGAPRSLFLGVLRFREFPARRDTARGVCVALRWGLGTPVMRGNAGFHEKEVLSPKIQMSRTRAESTKRYVISTFDAIVQETESLMKDTLRPNHSSFQLKSCGAVRREHLICTCSWSWCVCVIESDGHTADQSQRAGERSKEFAVDHNSFKETKFPGRESKDYSSMKDFGFEMIHSLEIVFCGIL